MEPAPGPQVVTTPAVRVTAPPPTFGRFQTKKKRKRALARPNDARAGFAQRRRRGEHRTGLWAGRSRWSHPLRQATCVDDSFADPERATLTAEDVADCPWQPDGQQVPLDPPVCREHNQPCIRRVSRGYGGRMQRAYYVCGQRPRCSFFLWEHVHRLQCQAATSWLLESAPQPSCDISMLRQCERAPALYQVSESSDFRSPVPELMPGLELRSEQSEALQHLLRGESVLLGIRPGSRRSMIYELYAALTSGTVLVCEPFRSLIREALENLPSQLPAAEITNNGFKTACGFQSLEATQIGAYKVLFCTPERLCQPQVQSFVEHLHPSAVVLDEAHLLLPWSAMFRPSYWQIQPLLKQHLAADTGCVLLAQTATPTPAVRACLATVVSGALVEALPPKSDLVPSKLHFSFSTPVDRYRTLVRMLSKDEQWTGPVLIYVSRQRDADALAAWLQNHLIDARSYHAGLNPEQRRKVEEAFRQHHCRVVVATSSSALRTLAPAGCCTVHWSIPSSIEDLLQQTSCAGKDRSSAFSHLFYDAADTERLRALALAEQVEPALIRKLVRSLVASVVVTSESSHPGNEGAAERFTLLDLATLQNTLDIPATILEQLIIRFTVIAGEAFSTVGAAPWRARQRVPTTLRITLHQTVSCLPEDIRSFCQELVRLSAAEAPHRLRHPSICNVRLDAVSQALSMSPFEVLDRCSRLQYQGIITMQTIGECIVVCHSGQPPPPLATQVRAWTDALVAERLAHQRAFLERLEQMELLARAVLQLGRTEACSSQIEAHFREWVDHYFRTGQLPPACVAISSPRTPVSAHTGLANDHALLMADIRALLHSLYRSGQEMHAEQDLCTPPRIPCTALQITRILQGIGSPGFPATRWKTFPFWGKYVHASFAYIQETVEHVLQRLLSQEDAFTPANRAEADPP